jgi:hypothetical protein
MRAASSSIRAARSAIVTFGFAALGFFGAFGAFGTEAVAFGVAAAFFAAAFFAGGPSVVVFEAAVAFRVAMAAAYRFSKPPCTSIADRVSRRS